MTVPHTGMGGDFLSGLTGSLPSNCLPHRTALIDGDMIMYAAAFRAEGKPFSVAQNAVQERLRQIEQETGANKRVIFLTGPTNFRNDVADDYKHDRADRKAPEWKEDLREWMIDELDAIVTEGEEADDAMAIRQHTANVRIVHTLRNTDLPHTIICTADKDLRMVAGWHYNWMSNDIEFIDPVGYVKKVVTSKEGKNGKLRKTTKYVGGGLMWFLFQMLTGDATDCIAGLPRLPKWLHQEWGIRYSPKGAGPGVAWGIYEMAQTYGPDNMLGNLRDFYRLARYAYRAYYCETGDEEWLKSGQLLWMRHHIDELWTPQSLSAVTQELLCG